MKEVPVILSIVTASRNRMESLMKLVHNLIAQPIPGKLEWLVVESYTDALTRDTIPWANFIRDMPPQGATHALNLAFPKCQGKYVMLLCDDMEPRLNMIMTAVKFMDDHPTVGQGILYVATPSHRCHVPPWHERPYGQVWIVRREVGEQVGWYDPACRHSGVDNDFSAKILSAGFGVCAIPGACVKTSAPQDDTHKESMSQDQQDTRLIEQRWLPRKKELAQIWNDQWAKLSGSWECSRTHE